MKLFFAILISFLIGWMAHTQNPIKTVSTSPTPKDCINDNQLNPEIVEKIVIKEVIKFVPKKEIIYKEREKKEETNSSEKDLFLMALDKDEFDEAMEYYQDADEEKHPLYQTALFGYFEKIKRAEPVKAKEQMQSFIEIEPKSKIILFQLVNFLKNQEKYQEALNLLIEFSYLASYKEKPNIYSKIKGISLNYIEKLSSTKSFQPIIDFLLNRMDSGVLVDFYSFELAKIYTKIKEYEKAIKLLEELKESKTYKERAKEMLVYIQNKIEELKEYPIQIPLIRDGLHFLVNAYVENILVRLMVDTGASITVVDYKQISHLPVTRENALFHTAGGDIHQSIFEAKTFTIGEVSLTNFTITGTEYAGDDQDGLLGMNFLGRFKFKIDQKEAILFLGEKH
jgi:clan AA aspartic protease (TIGR02281 family)